MTAGWVLIGMFVVVGSLAFAGLAAVRNRAKQAVFIRAWTPPHGLLPKLRAAYPQLSDADCTLVVQGLRQFFLAHHASGLKFVSMPSQAADRLWHEFILHTRQYQEFCERAFGRFLHHTPAVALSSERRENEGLRRCWWHACKAEGIDPRNPARVPLLFALDAKLGIPGGFQYAPQRLPSHAQGDDGGALIATMVAVHFGTDFSDREFDGTTDGLGDGGSGDSGGDGGSSCGGGGGD